MSPVASTNWSIVNSVEWLKSPSNFFLESAERLVAFKDCVPLTSFEHKLDLLWSMSSANYEQPRKVN